MKGHYFCEKCDDVAFGLTCQSCSSATTFIPDAPGSSVNVPACPASAETEWSRLEQEADFLAAGARAAVPRTPNFTAPPGWFEQLRSVCK